MNVALEHHAEVLFGIQSLLDTLTVRMRDLYAEVEDLRARLLEAVGSDPTAMAYTSIARAHMDAVLREVGTAWDAVNKEAVRAKHAGKQVEELAYR